MIEKQPSGDIPQSTNISTISNIAQCETTNVLSTRRDRFLDNPPNQPKKEIAEYVEQEGLLVPRRFGSLQEAMEHVHRGGKIMIRSEHKHEYNGASGLLRSMYVDKKQIELAKQEITRIVSQGNKDYDKPDNHLYSRYLLSIIDSLSQEIFEEKMKCRGSRIHKYCDDLGIDIQSFKEDISYSYREKIDGYNGSIVADSAVPGRYYIFTRTKTYELIKEREIAKREITEQERQERITMKNMNNCSVIDNGIIVFDVKEGIGKTMKEQYHDVIAFYEKIRNLEKFNPRHCPIVEFQTDEEHKNYFLQYHRTTETSPTTFVLERPMEEGEFKVDFVRGTTPPEGIEVVIRTSIQKNLTSEEGYLFLPSRSPADVKNTKMSVSIRENTKSFFRYLLHEHITKTHWFDPQIAVLFTGDSFPRDVWDSILDKCFITETGTSFTMKIVSDGRKAYAKILDY